MKPGLDRRRTAVLAIVLLVAAAARLTCLGTNPAGVFHDEAEKGYSAWSLARAGGVFDFTASDPVDPSKPLFKPWPLFIHVWGSLTSVISQYAALPFVVLAGGPGPWSVRLPSALAGILTVFLTFCLARALSRNPVVGLIAAAIVAVSPWHVMFSRWTLQGIYVPAFVAAGLWAFLKATRAAGRGSATRFYLFGAICLGLAFYSYSGARPFLALFYLWIAIIWRRSILRQWKTFLPALALLLVLLAPTFHAMFGGEGVGMGRFTRLSVWHGEGPFFEKLLLFSKNYLLHFSPRFLFLMGDSNLRHGTPGFGQMLVVEAPFLLLGLWTAFRRRSRADRLLLGWFFLFPLSAALTNEGVPHALRTLHAVPGVQIIAALGVARTFAWLGRRGRRGGVVSSAVILLWGANAAAFLAVLFFIFPRHSAFDFEYGVARAGRLARESFFNDESRLIVLPDARLPFIYELYLFHIAYPPEKFLVEGLDAAPVRPLSLYQTDPETLLRQLFPGDSALMTGPGYLRRYKGLITAEAFRIEIIPLWPARHDDPEPAVAESYVMIIKK